MPQPLRNCSHQAKPKKAASGAHPKNVAFGTSIKTMKSCPSHCETAATPGKAQESCVGSASEKAEPQQVLCRSHCETAARKMPKRRFWNPLKRKKYSVPKKERSIVPTPYETAARKVPKRCFWNLLKTKKKGCERLPQARHSAT